ERTRGCVRIVPSFERCEKPLTELYPVAGGFAPTRDALGAVIDDIERWTPPESACDEVLVVVPLGKIAPPAQPWVEWILTHGGRLVAHVAPSGQIPDATALLGSFFECADDALVRSQGWLRERIRVDPPEMVPDAVWRTLSTRRAPRTAWTRGDFRTFKMLAPVPAGRGRRRDGGASVGLRPARRARRRLRALGRLRRGRGRREQRLRRERPRARD